MRVRRYFYPQQRQNHDQPDLKNSSKRGYILNERKIRTRQRKFVNQHSLIVKNRKHSSHFQNSYEPNEEQSHEYTLKILLLGKWLTYASGFVVPTDTFSKFISSLKDGVILTKLLYNYFLLNDEEYYAKEIITIREKLILNPTTLREEEFNFNLFLDCCSILGLDKLTNLKFHYLNEFKCYKTEIIEKLLLLENTLFLRNNSLEDNEFPLESSNLNVIVGKEDEIDAIQEKRLTSYYFMAIKNRKRVLKERLASFEKEEEEKEKTYIDIAGEVNGSEEFWNLKEKENEERLAEIEEIEEESTSSSTISSIETQRESSNKEEDEEEEVEDTKSQIYYIVSPETAKQQPQETNPIANPEILSKDPEEMSLSSKLDLLMKAEDPEPPQSVKSTKSVTYYVIEELNEVDKGLTTMTDNILKRLAALKVKDRVVRAMDIFSVKNETREIKEKLEEVEILNEKQADDVISGFF